MIRKCIALYEETVQFVHFGTKTSNNLPPANRLMRYSQSKLGFTTAGILDEERILSFDADHKYEKEVLLKIFSYLKDSGEIHKNGRVSGRIMDKQYRDALRGRLKKLKYVKDIEGLPRFVTNMLRSIREEIDIPSTFSNHGFNTFGALCITRKTSDGVKFDAIMIDLPPSFPFALERVIMGSDRVFRDRRFPKSMMHIVKRDMPELFIDPIHIPWISTVLYTHGHFDHMGGTDFFRELVMAYQDKPISVYGHQRVIDKVKRFSPEYFRPQFFTFNKKDQSRWPELIDRINKAVSRLKGNLPACFKPLAQELNEKGYFVVTEQIDIDTVHSLFNVGKDQILKGLNRAWQSNPDVYPMNAIHDLRTKSLEELGIDHIEIALPFGKIIPRAITPSGGSTFDGIHERQDSHSRKAFIKEFLTYEPFKAGYFGTTVIPLDIKHGEDHDLQNMRDIPLSGPVRQLLGVERPSEQLRPFYDILGYYFPEYSFAYITDSSYIPPHTIQQLKDACLDHLVINGLWFTKKHPSHASFRESIEIVKQIEPKQTYFVHSTDGVYIEDVDLELSQIVEDEIQKENSDTRIESMQIAYDRMINHLKPVD